MSATTVTVGIATFIAGVVIGLVIKSLLHKPTSPPSSGGFKLRGAKFMHTFKQDRPDETVVFSPAKVVDAEGTVLPNQPNIDYTFTSSDESIVSIAQNNPTNPNELTFHYGSAKDNGDGTFAATTIKAESAPVTLPDNSEVVDIVAEDVTLIPGDAHGLQGGRFQFPGDVVQV